MAIAGTGKTTRSCRKHGRRFSGSGQRVSFQSNFIGSAVIGSRALISSVGQGWIEPVRRTASAHVSSSSTSPPSQNFSA